MADSPNQSRPIGASGSGARPGSSGELAHGPTSSRMSVPPSEPRGSRASFDVLDAQVDRPARLQMIVALILGLVLVAIPLYLWRRPRAESIAVSTGSTDAGALPVLPGASAAPVDEKLVLSEAKILSCHDPGPKRTLPEQCDHVVELEKGFAKAIEENAACVGRDAGGGSIIWLLEVGFASKDKKKAIDLTTPKEGRTLKNAKVVAACTKAIKSRLGALPIESMKHDHARYRVSITATYPGPVKP